MKISGKKQFEDWLKVKRGDTKNIQNWNKRKDRAIWGKYGMKGKSWNGRSNPKWWQNLKGKMTQKK